MSVSTETKVSETAVSLTIPKPSSDSSSQEESKSSLFPIFINWISAVTCVLTNKYVLNSWKHSTFLTAVHFTFTFLTVLGMLYFHFFDYKRLSVKNTLMLSALFCGSIAFNNLSILKNEIGFYQVMKIAVTPTVAFIEIIFLKSRPVLLVYVSLVVIIAGIVLMSTISFKTNVEGFIVAFLGTITTAVYQILPKQLSLKQGYNEYQLLLFQTPVSAVMLFFLVPFERFLDNPPTSVFDCEYSPKLLFGIGVTTFMSAFINLSIPVIIKRTSALTYNVVSHLKTITVLLGGVFIFDEELVRKKIIGILLSVAGIVWYSYLKWPKKKREGGEKGKGGGQVFGQGLGLGQEQGLREGSGGGERRVLSGGGGRGGGGPHGQPVLELAEVQRLAEAGAGAAVYNSVESGGGETK